MALDSIIVKERINTGGEEKGVKTGRGGFKDAGNVLFLNLGF